MGFGLFSIVLASCFMLLVIATRLWVTNEIFESFSLCISAEHQNQLHSMSRKENVNTTSTTGAKCTEDAAGQML